MTNVDVGQPLAEELSSSVSQYHVSFIEAIPGARVVSLLVTHTGPAHKIQTAVGSGAVDYDCQAISADLWLGVSSSESELYP